MKGVSERDVGTEGRDAPRSKKCEPPVHPMASCFPWLKRYEPTCEAEWARGLYDFPVRRGPLFIHVFLDES
jgi:hypothetical protein